MSTKQADERGFLSRWSARKKQNEDVPQSDLHEDGVTPDKDIEATSGVFDVDNTDVDNVLDTSPVSPATQSAQAAPVAGALDVADVAEAPPLLTDEDMPAIESLDAKSDISAFLNKGVSAALRRAALRHVFLQPEYNVRDGLNDYDGDFTVFEPLGDTVTADMKFHAARKERNRIEAERLAAEQANAEQANAEQANAEQANAEQANAEQANAEQADAEQADAEQADAEQLAAEKQPHARVEVVEAVNQSHNSQSHNSQSQVMNDENQREI